jgi:hypothetical protein
MQVTASKPDHDALYHRFFSDPAVVVQLLREFAAGPWLDGLDLEGLERLNTKFHADSGERREGDLVWRIARRDGGDAYVMLLLEFQSTPDHCARGDQQPVFGFERGGAGICFRLIQQDRH